MEEEPLISQVDMHIERIPNTPITSNCFVLHEQYSNECLIIDPGSEDCSRLITYLNQNELLPTTVFLTHEHFDHIWGVVGLSENYKFELICNQVCANAILNPKKNLSLFHDQVGFAIKNDVTTVEMLKHEFNWNGKKLKLIQTPGHSAGSISIQLDKMLFCGDLLIQDEKTVTKLPGGSFTKLKESFRMLKAEFSPETLIHSGHGENFPFKNYYIYNEL
jgi:hydroxyacylglutathione hydrolase